MQDLHIHKIPSDFAMAASFEVRVSSLETIRPFSPTPKQLRTYELSMLDQLSPVCHITIVLFFSGEPTSQTLPSLKASLSRTLSLYYPLAGRLDGVTIDCDDQGVQFYQARVTGDRFSQLLAHRPQLPFLSSLLFPCHHHPSTSCCSAARGALLTLQLTTFDCGGSAVAACFSHRVADGISVAGFLNAWAAEARGVSVEASLHPVLDAASLFPPVGDLGDTPTPPLQKRQAAAYGRFVFDAAAVKRPTASRVEAVCSIMQRCINRARAKAGSLEPAVMLHSVNLRRRATPPLPQQSFGNICTVVPVGRRGLEAATEEEDGGGSELRQAAGKLDGQLVGQLQGRERLSCIKKILIEAVGSGSDDLYCFTSWCGFKIYESDFGWGKPALVAPGELIPEKCVQLMDGRDRGVEAWVKLPEREMATLEKDEELASSLMSCTTNSMGF